MNLSELSKKEWYLEHFDGCPAFTEMTGSGFTRRLYNSKIFVYKINISYYGSGEGDWMSLVSDHKKIGQTIIQNFIKNKKGIVDLYKKWTKNFHFLMECYYSLFKEDISGLSHEELIKWYKNIYALYRKVSVPGFIDGYMFYADKRFDFIIREYCERNNISYPQKIFSILSAPIDPSFINEEEDDFKKLVKLIVKSGYKANNIKLKNFLNSKSNNNLIKLIEKHLYKYSWIKSSYAGYKEYLWKDIDEEIKRMALEKSKNKKLFNENKKLKDKLFKKYKFSPEIKAISRATEIFVKWQDQRKIYSLTFVSLQNKLLKEIAKRTKIDLELLKYCSTKEITKILQGNFNIKELQERKNACLFIYVGGKIIDIISGKKANEFLNKVSRIDINKINKIKGLSASMGEYTGKVKVITSAKNISKVNSGDILVAPMTRPEHLMGMKKAGAIITDDGGITCHAAIVARELGIPCIIGTKIATQVLKDGDLVEVDADKGLVKIINKVK